MLYAIIKNSYKRPQKYDILGGNVMKKIITFILAMLMMLSTVSMSGCSDKSDPSSKNDNSNSNTTESKVDLSNADLGGKTITIASWRDFNNKEDTSSVATERRKYFEQIEKELNCKIEWKVIDKETLTSQLITTALANDKFCDIAITVMWNTASILTNKAFTDLNSVSSINLNSDYYDQNANVLLDINGVQRATSCQLLCTPVSETAAVVFNKRILSECGLENPYTLYENNKWIVSKLREMAKKATKDLDGVSGMTINDQYGITTLDTGALAKDILAANNAYTITKTKGDNFTYNLQDEKVVNTLKYIQDWFCNDDSIFINSNQDTQHEQFSSGKSLFYIFQLSYLSKFKDMKDEYGIVPFPRGDEAENYNGLMNWNTSLMGIPSTVNAEELEDVGYVFEALAYYSRNDNENMTSELIGRYLRDDESVEMLNFISSNAVHSPDLIIATPRMDNIRTPLGQVTSGINDITVDIPKAIASNKNALRSALNQVSATLAME